MNDRRPVFLNLMQLRHPVGSITSIFHRITGVLLALGIPFAVCLFQLSLQSAESYARVASLFDGIGFRLPAILFIWALAHHLLAGVRHLLSDIDIGSRLQRARASAWMVNCSAVLIALLSAGALL